MMAAPWLTVLVATILIIGSCGSIIFNRQPPGSASCAQMACQNIAQDTAWHKEPPFDEHTVEILRAISGLRETFSQRDDKENWQTYHHIQDIQGNLVISDQMINKLTSSIGLRRAAQLSPRYGAKGTELRFHGQTVSWIDFKSRYLGQNFKPMLISLKSSHLGWKHWSTLIMTKDEASPDDESKFVYWYLDPAYPIVEYPFILTDIWMYDASIDWKLQPKAAKIQYEKMPKRVSQPINGDGSVAHYILGSPNRIKPLAMQRLMTQTSKKLGNADDVIRHFQGMIECKLKYGKNGKNICTQCMERNFSPKDASNSLLNHIDVYRKMNKHEVKHGFWIDRFRAFGINRPPYAKPAAVPILHKVVPSFVWKHIQSLYVDIYEGRRQYGLFDPLLFSAEGIKRLYPIFRYVEGIFTFDPTGKGTMVELKITKDVISLIKNPKEWTIKQTKLIRINEIQHWNTIYAEMNWKGHGKADILKGLWPESLGSYSILYDRKANQGKVVYVEKVDVPLLMVDITVMLSALILMIGIGCMLTAMFLFVGGYALSYLDTLKRNQPTYEKISVDEEIE